MGSILKFLLICLLLLLIVSCISLWTFIENIQYSYRYEIAKYSLELAKTNWIFGVGPGQYEIGAQGLVNDFSEFKLSMLKEHNFFLLLLAENGVLGLCLVMLYFLITIKSSKDLVPRLILTAYLLLTLAYPVTISRTLYFSPLFYFFLFISGTSKDNFHKIRIAPFGSLLFSFLSFGLLIYYILVFFNHRNTNSFQAENCSGDILPVVYCNKEKYLDKFYDSCCTTSNINEKLCENIIKSRIKLNPNSSKGWSNLLRFYYKTDSVKFTKLLNDNLDDKFLFDDTINLFRAYGLYDKKSFTELLEYAYSTFEVIPPNLLDNTHLQLLNDSTALSIEWRLLNNLEQYPNGLKNNLDYNLHESYAFSNPVVDQNCRSVSIRYSVNQMGRVKRFGLSEQYGKYFDYAFELYLQNEVRFYQNGVMIQGEKRYYNFGDEFKIDVSHDFLNFSHNEMVVFSVPNQHKELSLAIKIAGKNSNFSNLLITKNCE